MILTDQGHGRALLELARSALESELTGSDAHARRRAGLADSDLASWLEEPGATFVTLRDGAALRGCIGSLEAVRPLAEDLRANAVAAALRDPRFTPVERRELTRLGIEVSLLGPRRRIEASGEADLLRKLRPHVDGVVLRVGEAQATFLPQVWSQLPAPRDFLVQLRRKAGLPDDFWHPDLVVERYAVRTWTEELTSRENRPPAARSP